MRPLDADRRRCKATNHTSGVCATDGASKIGRNEESSSARDVATWNQSFESLKAHYEAGTFGLS